MVGDLKVCRQVLSLPMRLRQSLFMRWKISRSWNFVCKIKSLKNIVSVRICSMNLQKKILLLLDFFELKNSCSRYFQKRRACRKAEKRSDWELREVGYSLRMYERKQSRLQSGFDFLKSGRKSTCISLVFSNFRQIWFKEVLIPIKRI